MKINLYKFSCLLFYLINIIYISYIIANNSVSIGLLIDNNNKPVNGGFVVTGQDPDGFPTSNLALVRYLENGRLDETFNFNGIVTTYIDNGASVIQEMALDNNNKYVAVGGASYAPTDPVLLSLSRQFGFNLQDLIVARYNQDGSLDTTFNGTGIVRNPIIPTDQLVASAIGYALAIDNNNKITCSGFVTPLSDPRVSPFYLIRFNEDGSLDTSFNPTGSIPGILNTQLVEQVGQVTSININSIAIDVNDKIVCTGYVAYTIPNLSAISWITVRVNPDGTLDDTFGNRGVVITPIRGFDVAASLQIDHDNNIVVAGNASNGFVAVMALAKYDYSGNLLQSFGDNGIVLTNISNNTDRIQDIKIDSDNKIVAAGFTSLFLAYRTPLLVSSGDNFTMLRYNPDGSLDQTFGELTQIYVNIGTIFDPTEFDINAAPAPIVPPVTRNVFGIVQINVLNNYPLNSYSPFVPSVFPASPYYLSLDQLGRIVVTGFSSSAVEDDVTIMRLLPNGILDPSFFQPFNRAVPTQPGVVITFLSLLLGLTNLTSNSGYIIPPDYTYLLNPRNKKINLSQNKQNALNIAPPTLNSSFNNQETHVTNPLISGSSAPGSLINIYVNDKPLLKATTGTDGKWSSILPHLTDGIYSVHATASDRISSISNPSEQVKFKINTKENTSSNTVNPIKEAIKSTSAQPNKIQESTSAQISRSIKDSGVITGTVKPNQKISVFVDNVKQNKDAITPNKEGVWEFKIPKQYLNSKQAHKVSVAVDKAIQDFKI